MQLCGTKNVKLQWHGKDFLNWVWYLITVSKYKILFQRISLPWGVVVVEEEVAVVEVEVVDVVIVVEVLVFVVLVVVVEVVVSVVLVAIFRSMIREAFSY